MTSAIMPALGRHRFETRGAVPPAHELRDQLLRGFPFDLFLDDFNVGGRKSGIKRGLAERARIAHRLTRRRLVEHLAERREPAIEHRVEEIPGRLSLRRYGNTRREPTTRLEDASCFTQRERQIRNKLQAMAAYDTVEGGIFELQRFDVHDLEFR